jgi:hypothetical protein
MIAVALSGVTAWVVLLITQPDSANLYVINGQLYIKILVLDSVSKDPVRNAYIFQYDFDYPEKALSDTACTDQAGEATIVESRFIRGIIDKAHPGFRAVISGRGRAG